MHVNAPSDTMSTWVFSAACLRGQADGVSSPIRLDNACHLNAPSVSGRVIISVRYLPDEETCEMN